MKLKFMFNNSALTVFVCLVILHQHQLMCTDGSILDPDFDDEDIFPKDIPYFPVRKDPLTGKEVERGRFELLPSKLPNHYNTDPKLKVPLQKFKELLQCAKTEPTLNGNRGTLHMVKMQPPTKEAIGAMAVRAMTGNPNYKEIRNFIRDKQTRPGDDCHHNKERNLVRIVNGSLHLDWPWCFTMGDDKSEPYPSMTIHIFHTLSHISDMKDSVFMIGAEQSKLPFAVPLPFISNSPDFRHSDVPWPWVESLRSECILYEKVRTADKNFAEEYYRLPHVGEYKPWEQRYSKAAYFGAMIDIREIFFSQALARPDLIEARWTCNLCGIQPWTGSRTVLNPYFMNLQRALQQIIT